MIVGVWLGFEYGVSLRREGVGRFVSYLIRNLSINTDNSFEIWCTEENKAEVETLFEGSNNFSIITNRHGFLPIPFREAFVFNLKKCADILLRNQPIRWLEPAFRFKEAQKCSSAFYVKLFFIILLVIGCSARSARKVFPKKWALQQRIPCDELCEKANQTSHADVFLIPLVTLKNAAGLVHKKLLVMHDLATHEYENLFLKDSPNVQYVLENTRRALAVWERAEDLFFVSNSEHVRKTHVLKNVRAANPFNTFRVYLPANVDPVLIESSYDSAVLNRFKINGPYIFYPSQIRPHKNVNTLLRALASLRLEEGWADLRLVLTGKIEDCLSTRDLVDELKLENAIDSVGSVDAQDLMALYRHAAVSVIPTLFEGGFPWQALEALSVDSPVVISRIPAVQERLLYVGQDPDHSGLLLFDPNSWEDLAEKTRYAMKHRLNIAKNQHSIKSLLLKYTWRDAALQYQNLLLQITSQDKYGQSTETLS